MKLSPVFLSTQNSSGCLSRVFSCATPSANTTNNKTHYIYKTTIRDQHKMSCCSFKCNHLLKSDTVRGNKESDGLALGRSAVGDHGSALLSGAMSSSFQPSTPERHLSINNGKAVQLMRSFSGVGKWGRLSRWSVPRVQSGESHPPGLVELVRAHTQVAEVCR